MEYDPFHGIRLHAWVAIIENAPWCCKPRIENENSVFFIEPSTGFRFEINNPNYLGIESVWNQHNYYVRLKFFFFFFVLLKTKNEFE